MEGWRNSLAPNERAGPGMEGQGSIQQEKQICIISWNSRGSSELKLEYMKKLVSLETVGKKIPILCNQENFILKANSYRLSQAIPGFQFIINPAIKETQDHGRPKNGMFICIPDVYSSCVEDISPGHWRVQAVILSDNSSRTLLINSYFPFDKRENGDDVDLSELEETISVIKNVIRNSSCDSVIWAGDINADFTRDTAHSRTVKESIEEMNLLTAWDRFNVDFTCTYVREGVTFLSTLDHFHLSENISKNVLDAGVIHHPDNASDHEPIYGMLKSIQIVKTCSQSSPFQPKPSWRMASQEEKERYKYQLDINLQHIAIPTQVSECNDPHCKEEEHLEAIDWFSAETLEAVQRAGWSALPCPKAGKSREGKKATPGFTEKK